MDMLLFYNGSLAHSGVLAQCSRTVLTVRSKFKICIITRPNVHFKF